MFPAPFQTPADGKTAGQKPDHQTYQHFCIIMFDVLPHLRSGIQVCFLLCAFYDTFRGNHPDICIDWSGIFFTGDTAGSPFVKVVRVIDFLL